MSQGLYSESLFLINAPPLSKLWVIPDSHERVILVKRCSGSNMSHRIQSGEDVSGNSDDASSILSLTNMNALIKGTDDC